MAGFKLSAISEVAMFIQGAMFIVFAKSLCAGMEILAWFLLEGKYFSLTQFLYTTGLGRYQGPPEK